MPSAVVKSVRREQQMPIYPGAGLPAPDICSNLAADPRLLSFSVVESLSSSYRGSSRES